MEKTDEIVAEEDLVSKTAERLAALEIGHTDLSADDSEVVDDSTPVKDEDKQADDTIKEDDSTPDKDDDSVPDKDDKIQADALDELKDSTPVEDKQAEDIDKSKDSIPEKVELSDAYYRAAIHQEWTPEEIKGFLESNPELAKRTFAKIYESTNKLSIQYANLGRTQLKQEQKTAPEFKTIDVDELKKDYGEENEPLVNVVNQMQEQNKLLFDQVYQLQQQQQTQTVDSNVEQQVDNFFVGDGLKLYDDFYGAGKDSQGKVVQPDALTPGQKANRYAVLQLADQIRAGSALQGREMPVSEALELAHLNVTEPIREKKIREDIITKVVKREKGITLKGSGKKQVAIKEPGSLSDTDLETRAEARLAKLFK